MGHTHLIIGAGRMGGALIKGWTSGRKPSVALENLAILDPHPGPDAMAAIEAGATHLRAISAPMPDLTHLLLAVKPQMFDDIEGKSRLLFRKPVL